MRAALLLCLFTLPALALSAQAAEPTRVLVLRPTSTTVEASTLDIMTSLLSVELAQQRGQSGNRLDVVTASDVEKMATLAAEKSTVGCDTSSCLGEIAAAMGTRYVIFGDANKLGTLTIVTLNVFDADEARSITRKSLELDDVAQLPTRLRAIVPELAAPLLTSPHDDKKPTTTTAAPVNWASGAWSVGGVALGVVAVVGGVAFDVASDTSKNFALDGGDFIGPGLVVGGLVVGAVALFANPFDAPDDAAEPK